jgi:hypothetical protein
MIQSYDPLAAFAIASEWRLRTTPSNGSDGVTIKYHLALIKAKQ